ncbi:hypothetical protein [Aliikangiella maris]|uniref:PepSY domain-containing protein n=2 Tax=Aliikangiella maris TaxID=3162458 RepID=A0ABV3MKR7_9GAMM
MKKRFYIRIHKKLVWFAALTLAIWGISGILHPVMSWTGPKAKHFFAPPLHISPQEIQALPKIIKKLKNTPINSAKIVPSQYGPLLQINITTTQHLEKNPVITDTINSNLFKNQQPEKLASHQSREYYHLQEGSKITQHDKAQARWLANYYTGLKDKQILSVEKVTEHTNDYPDVNRLLPVYRITYNTSDQRVAYIHTETSSLALLSNQYRAQLQAIFKILHTWNWLDNQTVARITVIAFLMLTLLTMAVSGVLMISSLKSRKIANSDRRRHRALAYGLWLPVLAWSFSGFYHLLYNEWRAPSQLTQMAEAITLSPEQISPEFSWLNDFKQQKITSLSLTRDPTGQILFRLGIRSTTKQNIMAQLSNQTNTNRSTHSVHQSTTHQKEVISSNNKMPSNSARFDGIPSENSAIYINALTGQTVAINDKDRVLWLATQYFNVNPKQIYQISLITRFGNGYSFRHKRLPVWKLSLKDAYHTSIYIDAVTDMLIDKNRSIDRIENGIFSMLHKWNWLDPFTGRVIRDITITICILSLFGLAVIGIRLKLKSTKKIRSMLSSETTSPIAEQHATNTTEPTNITKSG